MIRTDREGVSAPPDADLKRDGVIEGAEAVSSASLGLQISTDASAFKKDISLHCMHRSISAMAESNSRASFTSCL